ncbi:MAG: type I glutamate--ammonia ligase [Actinobacteria bacterium]|jgi:glutamine synthetase|uniref:Glutamine synthetase n=1 Tax=freshwater metagenome TaxID=449393 RepID=A0A6J7HM51_9ZZZZ|nr:type I glutamate--ammonia ligase [Actinomycetota bacterium]MSW76928.1 type I glutamate--ammonia ligase [Actinomycetota bacterium]MSX55507.1 type I glutamate--ammonia ligase [Actinomycetota bacterium]MSX93441.1 type I glutamate--ammonia ligase [Actinomycetota bacterium]MSZ82834.1 type I glutamate--ammonia ligase [Actinomycetota bacterium]
MLDQQRDYVLRTVEERGVRLIRLWFTDVLGNLKSFAISPAELENALEDGMTFDGSAIDGFSRVQEADVLAMPDANTFEVLPWGDPKSVEARVFCDIHHLDGTPFEGDPRQVLRRNLSAARAKGFTLYVAPDMEFFYFAPPEKGQTPIPLDEGGFFDLTTTDVAGTLRKETIRTLETMSIPVEYSFHEDAPSQHEIDLRHTDALTMADSVMTFRLVVKEVAAKHGVHATFMPKPLEGVQGSGMHMHFSLFDGDDNAFYSADDPYSLSPVAKQFMAGLLRHAAEITAVTNQTINSYKRLVPGFEAPVHISWARNNRSGLIRVPIAKRGNPSATRIEYRSPDPACNPYLAFSVVLAAGLKGITEGYELPVEADANLFEMDDQQLAQLGIDTLPQSLSDSLKVMEKSELVREALGEHIFEWFLRNKRSEWRGYKSHVSQFELNRYLKAL